MSAYAVFNYTITNPEGYAPYPPAAGPTLASSGAEILVADYSSDTIEGGPGHVTVILRFESKEAARAWYESDAYQEAMKVRVQNTDGVAVLCDGFAPPS